MNFFFLSESFYQDYSGCCEIELKNVRPYVQVYIQLGGTRFAVPLRSHIKHPHVLWTDKENGCGLDFSKAVVVLKDEYIDKTKKPHIRQNEYDVLRGKEHLIQQKLQQYINTYKKAKRRIDVPRNRALCQYSTLQYFEEYI